MAAVAKKTKAVTHRQQLTKISSRRKVGGGRDSNGDDNGNNDDGNSDSGDENNDDGQ